MSNFFKKGVHSFLAQAAVAATLLILSGCASKSYVVLLPNDDGTTGKVVVSTAAGTTQLENKNEGALLTGTAGKPFVVSEEKIAKDFGAALAASPKKPITFPLYFETGGTRLTPASQADIPKVLNEISSRPAPDISIIGHTDTAGDADANYRLGLTRARTVAEIIGTTRISADRVTIESHGERNPLIRTPNNTDEPRNRRVEVTVR
ncbi:MAG: OmpA family protein [Betaproteobacteria bacterium]